MSSGSRLHTTLGKNVPISWLYRSPDYFGFATGTPMGFRSDSPIGMNSPVSWFKHSNVSFNAGSLFTTAGGSQSNQLGMSYAHQSFMIPASQSQTRFEPQETNGTYFETIRCFPF